MRAKNWRCDHSVENTYYNPFFFTTFTPIAHVETSKTPNSKH